MLGHDFVQTFAHITDHLTMYADSAPDHIQHITEGLLTKFVGNVRISEHT